MLYLAMSWSTVSRRLRFSLAARRRCCRSCSILEQYRARPTLVEKESSNQIICFAPMLPTFHTVIGRHSLIGWLDSILCQELLYRETSLRLRVGLVAPDNSEVLLPVGEEAVQVSEEQWRGRLGVGQNCVQKDVAEHPGGADKPPLGFRETPNLSPWIWRGEAPRFVPDLGQKQAVPRHEVLQRAVAEVRLYCHRPPPLRSLASASSASTRMRPWLSGVPQPSQVGGPLSSGSPEIQRTLKRVSVPQVGHSERCR
jgi:hypothetical protein